jgi:NADPH:quinone reductase-like Zn-dependent oxidoreductase
MQAIVYRTYGSPDVLELEEVETPTLRTDDDVLVRVHAVALNPLDWHLMRGEPYVARLQLGPRAPKRNTPGVDVAGRVEAVGPNVTQLRVGDEVWGSKRHGCAEFVVGPERLWIMKPARITLVEAAAIPAAGVTALQALRDKGGLQTGQTVLINGASGGVGTFAVQIAKWMGAEVTGVCSSINLELVRSLGADHVIDYAADDFTRTGQRYDVIIDSAANRTLRSMRRVLSPTGTLVLVGASKGRWIGPIARLVGANVLSRFVSQRLVGFFANPRREDLLVLNELVESGAVTPVIDRCYPLTEVPDAIRYLETLRARGKVVVTV